jgi:hypothetical protein
MDTTQGMSEATPGKSNAPGMPAPGAPLDANPPGEVGVGAVSISPMAVAQMEEEIARLTRRGYVIVNRAETSAQLKRSKHFSIWWALFWLLVGGLGLPLYIGWYLLVKRDRVAFIRITPDGRVLCSEG